MVFTPPLHIHLPALFLFLLVWVLCHELARLTLALSRNTRVICWALSPLGISVSFSDEPRPVYLVLQVLIPALISAGLFLTGFFHLMPALIEGLPRSPLFQTLFTLVLVLLSSGADVVNALLEFKRPLWGEARVLRDLRLLQQLWSYSFIHFTDFGRLYVREHFGATPLDLLQTL